MCWSRNHEREPMTFEEWLYKETIETQDDDVLTLLRLAWNAAYAEGYTAAERTWQRMLDDVEATEASEETPKGARNASSGLL